MRQRLFIFLGLGILIAILIGLNAVSFSQREKQPDNEAFPNRSTYNVGATGTRAFYDLLAETDRNPVRWIEPPSALLTESRNQPATFVIIGELRDPLSEDEAAQILKWVSMGGKLVVIDREPPTALVKTTGNWNVFFSRNFRDPFIDADSSDPQQMTAGVKAVLPVQPTVYTKNVNAVQPSIFTTSVNFEYLGDGATPKPEVTGTGSATKPTALPTFSKDRKEVYEPPPKTFPSVTPTPKPESEGLGGGEGLGSGRGGGLVVDDEEPAIVVKKAPTTTVVEAPVETVALEAPVVHLAGNNRNLLVDVPYGSGKIVFLTDPYIVANGGISLVDNAQLAINVVAAGDGIIAFDEYHQGYGSNQNRLLRYFAGTPVVPILLQIIVLVGLIFFSQSRRFARALPENEPNRLSKLEYVAAMAELQQRTKAFDLAIENIYSDFRRRVSRLVGVDNFTTGRRDLALLIVERLPDEKAEEIEELMFKCEEIAHGAPSGKKEVLHLASRLRELEEKLGLQRRKRQKKAV